MVSIAQPVARPLIRPIARDVRSWAGLGIFDWITPGAALDLDFVNGRYWPSADISGNHTRASTALMADADGVYQSFASSVLRQIDGVGALLEGASTNKCTNFNANPTDLTGLTLSGDVAATLTVVDDGAALAAAGLDGICTSGTVYKLDNSAGTTTAGFAATTASVGNTNDHAVSAFVRGSGNGLVELQGFGGTGTPFTDAYERRTVTRTPDGTGRKLYIQADLGAVVYFILTQLEEAGAASSPIITSGSAATRAADALTFDLGSTAHDYHALYDDDSTEVIAAAVTGSRDLVPDLSRPGVKRIWAVAV